MRNILGFALGGLVVFFIIKSLNPEPIDLSQFIEGSPNFVGPPRD